MENKQFQSKSSQNDVFSLTRPVALLVVSTTLGLYLYIVDYVYKDFILLALLIVQAFMAIYLVAKKTARERGIYECLDELKSMHSIDRLYKKSKFLGAFYNIVHSIQGQFAEIAQLIADLSTKEVSLKHLPPSSIIGKSIVKTNMNFLEIQRQEEQLAWKSTGLAQISAILLSDNAEEFQIYTHKIISKVVKYLDCTLGAIYVLRKEDDDSHCMDLVASIAWDEQRDKYRRFYKNEGLVGQVIQDKALINLVDIPKDYMKITSGLGESTPKNLVIIPLMMQDELFGAMELASFTVLEQYKIEFLKDIAKSIAYSFADIKSKNRTEELLAESQSMARELQAKEVVMGRNLEELEASKEEIKRNEARNHSILKALDNALAFAEITKSGELIDANQNMMSILREKISFIRKNVYNVFFGGFENYNRVMKRLEDGDTISEILKINLKSRDIWMHITYSPGFNLVGEMEKVLILSTDITVEKELELENAKKQKEIDSYLEAIDNTIASCEFDMEGNILSANNIFSKITGYNQEDLALKKYFDIIPDRDRDKPQAHMMWDSLKEGHFFSGEFNLVDIQGNEVVLSGTFTPVFSGNGTACKIVMLAQFITHEKEKEHYLNSLVGSIKKTMLFFELSTDGVIKNCSPYFLSTFGYKKSHVIRRNIFDFIENTDEIVTLGNEKLTGIEDSFSCLVKIKNNFGETVECHATFNSLYSLTGQLERIVLIMSSVKDLQHVSQ